MSLMAWSIRSLIQATAHGQLWKSFSRWLTT